MSLLKNVGDDRQIGYTSAEDEKEKGSALITTPSILVKAMKV